jgi:hypothetical protein
MRRALALALPLLGAAAACTSLLGDFTLTPAAVDAGIPDSGGEPDRTEPDAPTVTVHAVVTSLPPVFTGHSVTLDASNSTTTQGSLAFSWQVGSIPPGSLVDTSFLSSAASATPSFVPDVPGNYDVTVTVSAAGASDSQEVTVTAVAPQVLFASGSVGDGGAEASPSLDYFVATLTPEGGAPQPLLCADAAVPLDIVRLGAYAGRAFDTWEAPAGEPSRFAAFTLEADPDGGYIGHLWAGTFDAPCSPVDFGTSDFGPNAPFGSEPSFSPDGTRFAVFDSHWNVVTFPVDGSGDTNVVAAYGLAYAEAGAALDPIDEAVDSGYVLEPPRVGWRRDGVLAWARPLDDSNWELVTAPDAPDAEVTQYMHCGGVTPREIAMLADGTVIAAYRDPTLGPGENIVGLTRSAYNLCSHDLYAIGPSSASIATDFALSPDGTELAFLWRDPPQGDGAAWPAGLPGGYVFVMPVSNPVPVQVSNERALYGPRWIASGATLAFTRFDGIAASTGDVATTVIAMGPDGSAERVIAQGALVPRTGSPLPWPMMLVLFALARLLPRRRRSIARRRRRWGSSRQSGGPAAPA